jgi:LysM repeat protein
MVAYLLGGGAIPDNVSHPATKSPSAAPPAAPAAPASATGPQPTTPAQAWAQAEKQAIANEPQPHTTVVPGNTLTAIAEMFHQSLMVVEDENSQQIPDPNLIYPGQQVKLPKTEPAEVVPPIGDAQIKPIIAQYAYAETAQYYVDHDPQAFPGADRAQIWGGVTQATYTMLTNNNKSAYPDTAGLAEIKTLTRWSPATRTLPRQTRLRTTRPMRSGRRWA